MTSRVLQFMRDSCIVLALSLSATEVWFLCSDRWFIGKFAAPTDLAYGSTYETPDGTRVSYFAGPIRKQLHPFFGYQHVPNQSTENFTINGDGFRGQPLTKLRDDNLTRIVIIGGSTAFGYGVSTDANTISSNLSSILESVEILNAGVIAYQTGNEYPFTRERLLQHSPDLVLAIHGWNDFQAFLTMRNGNSEEFVKGFSETIEQLTHLRNITQDNPFTRIPFGIVTVLFPRSERAFRQTYLSWVDNANPYDRLQEIDLLTDRFVESIRRMRRLAQHEGFEFVSFLQPDLNVLAYLSDREFSQPYLRDYAQGYQEFCKLVLQRAAAESLPIYDLGQFSNTFDIHHFIDAVHLSDSGSKVAAELIASRLTEQGFVSRKQQPIRIPD